MSSVNNVVQFPTERIVRELDNSDTAFYFQMSDIEDHGDFIQIFEPIEGNFDVSINQDDLKEQKFLDIYIEMMQNIDMVISKQGMMSPYSDEEAYDGMQKSYYLMQQAIVAYIARHLDEKHVLQEVADLTVKFPQGPGHNPEFDVYGIVTTPVDENGEIEYIMFEEEDTE